MNEVLKLGVAYVLGCGRLYCNTDVVSQYTRTAGESKRVEPGNVSFGTFESYKVLVYFYTPDDVVHAAAKPGRKINL